MTLKQQLTDDMKAAMRGGDKHRLGVIRLVLAAVKQREVDERIELDDAQTLAVLEKMLKQRRDSVSQYAGAGREDLADVERAEMTVIEAYLPAQLDAAELDALIAAAIAGTGASSPRDMGKVMAAVKEQAAGRADMAQVSARIKAKLAG
ncbi:GatB/YqeY domain-containing protein [Rhodanobacter sp. Si-c]|uniref:GatB/YqeY domain-containing protein n=1 Tax=Rhodanobacter lycopersici TaxID=3162487 RepID=A0ABV3QDT7_9GAMM